MAGSGRIEWLVTDELMQLSEEGREVTVEIPEI